jgi:inositol phosphorylceramide mannosyltransferase catalytic subunit
MQTRARLLLLLIPLLISLVYTATRIVTFAHIFFEHSGIALTQAEIRDTYQRYAVAGGKDPRKEWIPRHIHQVWHDWSAKNASTGAIPEDWDEVRGTCRSLMPDWEYTVCCVAFPGGGGGMVIEGEGWFV